MRKNNTNFWIRPSLCTCQEGQICNARVNRELLDKQSLIFSHRGETIDYAYAERERQLYATLMPKERNQFDTLILRNPSHAKRVHIATLLLVALGIKRKHFAMLMKMDVYDTRCFS